VRDPSRPLAPRLRPLISAPEPSTETQAQEESDAPPFVPLQPRYRKGCKGTRGGAGKVRPLAPFLPPLTREQTRTRDRTGQGTPPLRPRPFTRERGAAQEGACPPFRPPPPFARKGGAGRYVSPPPFALCPHSRANRTRGRDPLHPPSFAPPPPFTREQGTQTRSGAGQAPPPATVCA